MPSSTSCTCEVARQHGSSVARYSREQAASSKWAVGDARGGDGHLRGLVLRAEVLDHLVRREHIAAYLLPPLGQDLISPDLRERLHLLLPLHDQELGLEYLEGALLHTPCIDHA